jgi:hypothetical protein
MATHNCAKNGCPPNVDMRTCEKALQGNCPFVASSRGGLYWREQELFNQED